MKSGSEYLCVIPVTKNSFLDVEAAMKAWGIIDVAPIIGTQLVVQKIDGLIRYSFVPSKNDPGLEN